MLRGLELVDPSSSLVVDSKLRRACWVAIGVGQGPLDAWRLRGAGSGEAVAALASCCGGAVTALSSLLARGWPQPHEKWQYRPMWFVTAGVCFCIIIVHTSHK